MAAARVDNGVACIAFELTNDELHQRRFLFG
jgi:hypothetical protein